MLATLPVECAMYVRYPIFRILKAKSMYTVHRFLRKRPAGFNYVALPEHVPPKVWEGCGGDMLCIQRLECDCKRMLKGPYCVSFNPKAPVASLRRAYDTNKFLLVGSTFIDLETNTYIQAQVVENYEMF